MSRELRRRLHEVDPDLKIAYGRRPKGQEVMRRVPRVLSPQEAKQWGLPEMIPIMPADEVLHIEGQWSKKQLQEMALEYFLDPKGGKDDLVEKLVYIGALDARGRRTGLPARPAYAPYVIPKPKQFCCSICGACAPDELLAEGRFFDRMAWLRDHYKTTHPGEWGKE